MPQPAPPGGHYVRTVTPDRRPLVVFVCGWGRSGSTVLEQMLAHVPGTIGIGEVWNLWGKGFERNETCSCGRPVRSCPLWTEVAAAAFGGLDAVDGRATARRMRGVARLRSLPVLLGVGPVGRRRRELEAYRRQLAALYRAVADVAGAAVIVDTSKNPQHGFVLRGVPGIDVAVVHLVRDARAVAFSWARTRATGPGQDTHLPRRAPLRSAWSWTVANLLSELLRLVHGRASIRVRYEDLCAAPVATIGRIAALAGVDDATVADALDGGARPLVHAAAGNPVRLEQGPVVVRLDDEWARAPWPGRRLVTALTAPLLLRYGYGVRVRP